MNFRPLAIGTLAAALLLPMSPEPAPAQNAVGEYRGAAALGLQLRRLGTTKRVLMVGAHPDDEDTQLLARFALEEGADVAYLSLTRGEGGQNGIGPELGEGLGLLRTEELLAARRVDGAQQFFTRAYDFGFSKSAEETFRHWPREELLRDVVTRHPPVPPRRHRHRLQRHAARRARPPPGVRHPGARGVHRGRRTGRASEGTGRPWQPAQAVPVACAGTRRTPRCACRSATWIPLIGRSPFQLAMASRSLHRSQDMGRPELPGPRWGTLRRILPEGAGTEPSIWARLDTTLALAGRGEHRGAGAARYQQQVETVRSRFNPLEPRASAAGLLEALRTLRLALDSLPRTNGVADLSLDIRDEIGDVEAAAVMALGLVIDGVASDARLAPGQAVERGGLAVERRRGRAPRPRPGPQHAATAAGPPIAGRRRTRTPGAGGAGRAAHQRKWRVHVPAEARAHGGRTSSASPRDGDLYRWDPDAATSRIAQPFERRAADGVRLTREVNGTAVNFCSDVTFREVDLRQGELRRPVMVVPAVSVLLDPPARVLSTAAPRPITYTVRLAAEQPGGIGGHGAAAGAGRAGARSRRPSPSASPRRARCARCASPSPRRRTRPRATIPSPPSSWRRTGGASSAGCR